MLEQGAFAPLELLFNSGRLLYSDYESWRRREIDFLDAVLMGNPDKIKAELDQAVSYARRIKLVEQPQEFHAWHSDSDPGAGAPNDRPLRISLDPQLQRLIGSRYIRAQSVPQMDLFFDNPVVALTNGIVQALTTRNLPAAQRQLDQLYAQAPTHADLAAFDQLLAALGHLGHAVGSPREESAFLLEVAPTARRLLGGQARDLLSPLWTQVAQALAEVPFDPSAPELHRSFALTQAQDWAGASDSIRAEPDWQQHAALCLRRVESAFHQRHRIGALEAWCHFCWRSPTNTSQAVSKLRQPELTELWQRFQDDEEAASGAGEHRALSESDFPATLLLSEPGLVQQLPETLPTQDTPSERHYRTIHRWIQARRARRHDEELALRKTLQANHPALFEVLKRTVG